MVMTDQLDWTTGEIMKVLLGHLREDRPVLLYNTYKGVPVVYEAEVAMVHTEYVGLMVHPFQTVCIRSERRTFLESKSVPGLIQAYPVSINYTNNVVLLKNLQITQALSADLLISRVRPEEPVMAEMDSDLGIALTGTLSELAVLAGNEVWAAVEVPDDVPYVPQDEIELVFKLPESGERVQVWGVVASLEKIPKKETQMLEVRGKAGMHDEISLLAYIARHEDVIMGSLEREYKRLRKGKKLEKHS